MIVVDPKYGGQDNDTMMFLRHLREPPGTRGLEVGANEEHSCHVLTDAGYDVVGADLRPHHDQRFPETYCRLLCDFVEGARHLRTGWFDFAWSTSALEHFGLGMYGMTRQVEDHDSRAVDAVWPLLKPGGSFYVTVPYGREFLVYGPHWRVYCRETLRDRIVRSFDVVEKVFFKSGDCPVPDDGSSIPLVREADADLWTGEPPHLTVFLHLKKG